MDVLEQVSGTYQPLPLKGLVGEQWRKTARLNCLGSLYWFIKVGLRKKRLTNNLHKPFCLSLEREHIKDVYEIPRDHFKSTMCSEGLPMWRVLWCSDEDLNEFQKLGYSSEFLAWMRRIHRPQARNLLVSENITNAGKLGRRIDFHYESNSIFRHLFPELIPTSSETWSNISKWQRLPTKLKALGGHGEGTFDFLGVGGALQSRHYDGIVVQDDLVGKKAYESITVMEKTIEYHRLLVGAFENEDAIADNDELVVSNRWSYSDLNSWIRENEPWFTFETHSAMGGCCEVHPPDTPIFPEEFSTEKLERWRKRLGSYLYSCQFLNDPAAPENADFHESDLRYITLETVQKDGDDEIVIHHRVHDGVVIGDVKLKQISKCIVTDPNHSGAGGRCRHSIQVVGLSAEGRYYHLASWAKACNTDEYIEQLYKMCGEWGMTKLGIETVAAQKYLAYHINFRNRLEGRNLRLIELKGEVDAPDGTITRNKEFRIRNVLSPIFESNRFYTQEKFMDFRGEYTTFPKGKFVDILDSLAYVPQMLRLPASWIEQQKWKLANAKGARMVNLPYSVGVR
jgi:hypothetical protein